MRARKTASARMIAVAYRRKPVTIKHSSLERADESPYRSNCPACKDGILLVRRDQKTLEILAEDNCVSCGQRFVYSDVGRLRRMEEKNDGT